MITELLGLASSGILGSFVSIISDWMQGRREQKLLEEKTKIAQWGKLNESAQDHINKENGFAAGRTYSLAFLMLTATYCTAILLFSIFPDVVIKSLDPQAAPTKINLLFASIEWHRVKIYHVTTGGVAYALLHILAYQIGTVITGISPMRK